MVLIIILSSLVLLVGFLALLEAFPEWAPPGTQSSDAREPSGELHDS